MGRGKGIQGSHVNKGRTAVPLVGLLGKHIGQASTARRRVTSKEMNGEGNGLEWPKDRDGGKGLFLRSTRVLSLEEIVLQRMLWHMGVGTKKAFPHKEY